MWHEARKQEKKLREVMVDYQRRAERRKEHYEKLKGDPHQFFRIYGNKCKLHLDPKTASTLDSTMIPWQGDASNIISQYDVRIHMDYIPDYSKLPEPKPTKEEKYEESKCNYERYRTLVQNAFHKISEADALNKINVEEMYPEPLKKGKKKKSGGGVAIGYSYGYGNDKVDKETQQQRDEDLLAAYLGEEEEEKAFSSESEYEIDMDVDTFKSYEVDRLNLVALDYGVQAGSFSRSLRADKSELVEQKLVRIAEMEKSALSGRKSRRERRNWKENHSTGPRLPTPPSYAQRGSPTYEPYEGDQTRSRSSSHSSSPASEGKVEFITEFGGEDETEQVKKEIKDSSSNKPSKSEQKGEQSRAVSHTGDDHSHRRSHDARRGSDRERDRLRGNYVPSSSSRMDRRGDSHEGRSGRGHYHSSRYRSSSPERSNKRSSRYKRSRSRSRDRYFSSRRRTHRSRSRSRSRNRNRDRSRDQKRDRSRDWNRDRRDKERRYHSTSRSRTRSHSRSRDRSHSTRRESHSRSSSSSSERSPPRKRVHSGSRSKSPESTRSHSRSRSRSLTPVKKSDESADTKSSKLSAKPLTTADKNKLTHKERMMKKMQALLNKQHKMDKKAQKARDKVKKAERLEREEELREQQKKLKDVLNDEPSEPEYTISGAAETYKSKNDHDDSPAPDSPHRILTLGFSDTTNQDNGRQTSCLVPPPIRTD